MSRDRIARSVLAEVALQREEFARRLREARHSAGLTQEQAAQKIGVTLKSFNRWEAAKGATPHLSRMDDIAKALGVTREYLQGPPPAPLGMDVNDRTPEVLTGVQQIARQLEQADARQTRYARYLNAKLDLLFAHLGVQPDQLPAAPDELTAALDEIQARPKRSRRAIQPPSVSGQS